MGSDTKNLMNDGDVQIVKIGEVTGVTQLIESELIAEAGGRAENTVVTGVNWLKVATDEIVECAQYGDSGTLSVNDGATAIDIAQSEGGTTSLPTLATINGRHPEGGFSVDKGYACGLLLENSDDPRVSGGHRVEKVILNQEDDLLVNGTTSVVMVDEGGELLVYPGGEASNCEINQSDVFMLVRKANDTLFAGGAMNNLGGEDSDTIVENGAVCRLGTDGLQLYSFGGVQNLSINVGDRTEVHADTPENTVIQGGVVILLSPASVDENLVAEEDRTPAGLTDSVALLDGASMIIGYDADLQRLTATVQQGGALILDGSTVKDDNITFSVGNTNLNGGKLWLITDATAQVYLKVKRLRGEGVICLQTSAREIPPGFANVKGEVTGDTYAEIIDASRQTLCNVLKSQPDEDGIDATLQPA